MSENKVPKPEGNSPESSGKADPNGKAEFLKDLPEDLGLDADRSSDNENTERKYNMDNDISSGESNEDGDSSNEPFDSSPIMNK